jgi:hypothetical protein
VLTGVDGQRDAVDDLLAVAAERDVGELENRGSPARDIRSSAHAD